MGLTLLLLHFTIGLNVVSGFHVREISAFRGSSRLTPAGGRSCLPLLAKGWTPGDAIRGSDFRKKGNRSNKPISKPIPPIPITETLHPVSIPAQIEVLSEETPEVIKEPAAVVPVKFDPITVPELVIAMSESKSESTSSSKTFDGLAALSYLGATATQLTLMVSFLHLVQLKLLPLLLRAIERNPSLPPIIASNAPSAAITMIFILFTLRSRIFSPLDNSRPRASENDPVFKERLRPWWQPPPLAFPIIWSSIAVLRVVSSLLIWQTTKTLLCKPIFAFALHLSVGDTWNTINNVEKRLGTAVSGVVVVLASIYFAVYQYYKVLPLAAKVLAPSAVWLTVATFLVYSIWRLNSQLFDRPSLFPSKEEGPPCKWHIPLLPFKK